jgi:large subunit ribosomal protein L17
MLRNMVTSLFEHERITTTLAKAKEARPVAERLITKARRGATDEARLAARRHVSAYLRSEDVARKLMDDIAPRYATRPGGYTRIYRLGPRPGDAGQMGILELVDRKIVAPKPEGEKKDGAKRKGKAVTAEEASEKSATRAAKAAAKAEKGAAKPKKEKPEKERRDKREAEKRRESVRERSRSHHPSAHPSGHSKPTQATRKSGGSSKSGRDG